MTGTATPSLERDARGGVLVVGGYGQVGSRAARRLLAAGYRVVLAGRSASRAAAVASELGCDHARIDVIDERTWGPASEDAATVLCCVDQTDETFVRWVLGSGRDYVDITANDDFFRRVERLGADAEQGRATALLSVGLAPGLTNLMVKRLADPLEVREEAVIAVRLGLGERHGDLAIEWALRQLATSASWETLTSFEFPGEESSTSAIPIDIADQHVVRRTLGFAHARTMMTLESSAWTRGVVLLAPALRRKRIRAAIRRLLPRVRFGRDAWTVAVEVRGVAGGRPTVTRLAVEGVCEAEGTGAVAARLVHLLKERRRPGIFHAEQLFELEEALEGVDADMR